jgi:hypothetical protein
MGYNCAQHYYLLLLQLQLMTCQSQLDSLLGYHPPGFGHDQYTAVKASKGIYVLYDYITDHENPETWECNKENWSPEEVAQFAAGALEAAAEDGDGAQPLGQRGVIRQRGQRLAVCDRLLHRLRTQQPRTTSDTWGLCKAICAEEEHPRAPPQMWIAFARA